ncbi:intercellular trafficking and secretion [Blastocladiella emersonii ATCC 22665]|nr:intercellular trafficking and secretion [Blastocladiella emersonii ATCC 22665]
MDDFENIDTSLLWGADDAPGAGGSNPHSRLATADQMMDITDMIDSQTLSPLRHPLPASGAVSPAPSPDYVIDDFLTVAPDIPDLQAALSTQDSAFAAHPSTAGAQTGYYHHQQQQQQSHHHHHHHADDDDDFSDDDEDEMAAHYARHVAPTTTTTRGVASSDPTPESIATASSTLPPSLIPPVLEVRPISAPQPGPGPSPVIVSPTLPFGNSVGGGGGGGGTADPRAFTSFPQIVPRRSPYDIAVTGGSKQGEGIKEAYVAYTIVTTDVARNKSSTVYRRFTDFDWLHAALVAAYPAVIVCPLPSKHRKEYLTGDRFSAEFIDRRRHSLQRFLNRIARHPVLQASTDLYHFLTAHDWNLEELKSASKLTTHQRSLTGGSATGSPDASGNGLAVGAAAAAPSHDGIMDNLSGALTSAFAKLKRPDPRFVAIKDGVQRLEEQLTALSKVHKRAVQHQVELESDLHELGRGWAALANLEPDMAPTLTAVAELLYELARARGDATRCDDVGVGTHIRDALAMCAAVRASLKTRDAKQQSLESLADTLAAYENELARLRGEVPPHAEHADASGLAPADRGGAPGAGSGGGGVAGVVGHFIKEKYDEIKGVDHDRARAERAAKLDGRVRDLTAQVEAARAAHDTFSSEIAKEIDYATAARAADFRDMLTELADGQVTYFESSLGYWESMAAALETMPLQDPYP